MLADRAMWASVALADHIRNGVSLEDVPMQYAGRALAALANLYRVPVGDYWESRIQNLTGANYLYMLEQDGHIPLEMMPVFDKNAAVIEECLAGRSWSRMRTLPPAIWKLMTSVTGMEPEDWESLPEFCREVMLRPVLCQKCEHHAPMQSWGKPHPIDDPMLMYSQSISLVFDCPICSNEVTYDIVHKQSREFHPVRFTLRRLLTMAFVLSILALPVGFLVYVLFFRLK